MSLLFDISFKNFTLFSYLETPNTYGTISFVFMISHFLSILYLHFFPTFLIPVFRVPYCVSTVFYCLKMSVIFVVIFFSSFTSFLRSARSLSSLSGILPAFLSSRIFALGSYFIKVFINYLRFLWCHIESFGHNFHWLWATIIWCLSFMYDFFPCHFLPFFKM